MSLKSCISNTSPSPEPRRFLITTLSSTKTALQTLKIPYVYALNLIFVQSANLARFVFTAYAIEASEVVETPVFPFLIFSTSCALNS